MAAPVLADLTGNLVVSGAGALLAALAGYLFTQLRHNDDQVWKIIEAKDEEIVDLKKDRDYWRERFMSSDRPRRRT